MSLIEGSVSIPLQSIKVATKYFTDPIGRGGYGPVYRAELAISDKPAISVAVKRLNKDNVSGQGLKEFLTEIHLLSRYKHHNLVSLLGVCQEDGENILIYEYAHHGSLDKYLYPSKTTCPLTWKQRVTICLDAACGLDYLHNRVQKDLRVIHRDIKSGNILLNQNWEALIADLGLSKIGRTNEGDTYIITDAAGTDVYCDPVYRATGILTKESDVYSFGVVLFEVLAGRLCHLNVNSKKRFLISLVQEYYGKGKYDEFVDPELKKHIDFKSMKVFSGIAYECLHNDRKSRPSMGRVVEKLEKALQLLVAEELVEEHEVQVLELEEALGLQMLVKTLQRQEFVEACELKELEEALALQVLELEEALGLQMLVKTLERQEFVEACELKIMVQDLEEALALQKLVETLQCQELVEALKLQVDESLIDYEVMKVISMMPNTRLACIAREEVYPYLSTGILVDEDKVWLSIDNHGKTREMISAMKSVYGRFANFKLSSSSRFPKVAWIHPGFRSGKTKLMIRTQFLSSGTKYGAYLVFKAHIDWDRRQHKLWHLKYTLHDTAGDEATYESYNGVEYNDSMMIELFQTMGAKRISDFEITLEDFKCIHGGSNSTILDGIMFVPLHKYEDDEITTSEVDNLPTSSEIQWDDLLPSDYKQFIKYSNKEMMKTREKDVTYPTKEEAYSILSRGVHINIDDRANYWFWITSNGKKHFLIQPAETFGVGRYHTSKRTENCEFKPSNESRLGRVLEISISDYVYMNFFLNKALLLRDTSYACYLVYQIPTQGLVFTRPVTMKTFDYNFFTLKERYQEREVFLDIPKIPVIGSDGKRRSSTMLTNASNMEYPIKRNDGWLEVKVCSSEYSWELKQSELPVTNNLLSCIWDCVPWSLLDMRRSLNEEDYAMTGSSTKPDLMIMLGTPYEGRASHIIVQGLELRPV